MSSSVLRTSEVDVDDIQDGGFQVIDGDACDHLDKDANGDSEIDFEVARRIDGGRPHSMADGDGITPQSIGYGADVYNGYRPDDVGSESGTDYRFTRRTPRE